jgi:hypothetical protein
MNKIKKIILIIIAFFLIIFGTLFIVAGIANEQIMTQLKQNGISVQGIVTDKNMIRTGKYAEYQLLVTYTTAEGEKITHIFNVDEDDFEHSQKMQEINVTYVQDKPDWIVIGEEFNYDRRPLYLGIAAFISGFLILFIVFSAFRIIKHAWNKKS